MNWKESSILCLTQLLQINPQNAESILHLKRMGFHRVGILEVQFFVILHTEKRFQNGWKRHIRNLKKVFLLCS